MAYYKKLHFKTTNRSKADYFAAILQRDNVEFSIAVYLRKDQYIYDFEVPKIGIDEYVLDTIFKRL